MLTAQTLRNIFPQCPDPELWAQALAPAMERYGIDTPARMASFLAQTGHESAQFSRLAENLRRSGIINASVLQVSADEGARARSGPPPACPRSGSRSA